MLFVKGMRKGNKSKSFPSYYELTQLKPQTRHGKNKLIKECIEKLRDTLIIHLISGKRT